MSKRNYGIDLLRCISMMLVVVLHVMGHGKILATVSPESVNYKLAWFLEIIAYCSVNCYALISGYVGIRAKHRYRNIVTLWLQVAFYSVGIALLFQFINPASIDLKGILSSVFPVMSNSYWYFTAYFALFFLTPLLNAGVNALTKNDAKKLIAGIIGVFSIIRIILCCDAFNLFKSNEIFNLNNGYSVLWLAFLYIVGGCISKFELWKDTKNWKVWAVFWGSVIFSWAFKMFIENPSNKEFKSIINANTFLSYLSPTIVVTAICLLILFSRLETLPKVPQKIVSFFAPVSFSVYLIHDNSLIRNNIIAKHFSILASLSPIEMMLHIFVVVLTIFVVCSLIDHIRILIFKLFRVKEIVNKVAECKICKNKK